MDDPVMTETMRKNDTNSQYSGNYIAINHQKDFEQQIIGTWWLHTFKVKEKQLDPAKHDNMSEDEPQTNPYSIDTHFKQDHEKNDEPKDLFDKALTSGDFFSKENDDKDDDSGYSAKYKASDYLLNSYGEKDEGKPGYGEAEKYDKAADIAEDYLSIDYDRFSNEDEADQFSLAAVVQAYFTTPENYGGSVSELYEGSVVAVPSYTDVSSNYEEITSNYANDNYVSDNVVAFPKNLEERAKPKPRIQTNSIDDLVA